MSIEKVRAYFNNYGMEDRILEFNVSSATVPLAAKALNTTEGRIAKSLSFMLPTGPIIIVVAGDKKIDNHKFKTTFRAKAKMLTPEEVDSLIGHSVGGVCPFAVKDGVRIYLDVSLKEYETVFPACGSGSSAIELTIEEMEKYSSSLGWVDVTKALETTSLT